MRCCRYGAGALADGVLGGGMGRLRILASEVLHRLTAGGSPSMASAPGSCGRTRRLTAAFLARSPASNIDKEGTGLGWDDDWV